MKRSLILNFYVFLISTSLNSAFAPHFTFKNDIPNKYLHIFTFADQTSTKPMFETILEKADDRDSQKVGNIWEFGKITPDSVIKYFASEYKELDKDIAELNLPIIPIKEEYINVNRTTNFTFFWQDDEVKVEVLYQKKFVAIGEEYQNHISSCQKAHVNVINNDEHNFLHLYLFSYSNEIGFTNKARKCLVLNTVIDKLGSSNNCTDLAKLEKVSGNLIIKYYLSKTKIPAQNPEFRTVHSKDLMFELSRQKPLTVELIIYSPIYDIKKVLNQKRKSECCHE